MLITEKKKIVYGLTIGIIIMDTRFRRLPGDIGYAPTWPFPVQYAVAKGAIPQKIVENQADGLLDAFIEAADSLVEYGVDGIVTSCGYLAKEHIALTRHCKVPVAASSLLQIPLARSIIPYGKEIGVITLNEKALGDAHFEGVGLKRDMTIVGLPEDSIVKRNNRSGAQDISYEEQCSEVMDAADRMMAMNPNIGGIVIECTNLAPYATHVQSKYKIPVFDVVTLVHWMYNGLKGCANQYTGK